MTVEVVTVYAPRPSHPKWRDYLTDMGLQRDTAKHWGARHVVVSDSVAHGFNVMHVAMPASLMHAQLTGQIAYLEKWSGEHPVLLVDADCLIARDPAGAFDGRFDIGLTWRNNPECMINNGAMYVSAGSKAAALRFFRHALTLCKEHWGGDQEAISQAAAPVLMIDDAKVLRHGAIVRFLSMRKFNCVPEIEGKEHGSKPFVVHFKGEERKDWMRTYAEKFILKDTV